MREAASSAATNFCIRNEERQHRFLLAPPAICRFPKDMRTPAALKPFAEQPHSLTLD
jgi:hypothetical protein